MDSVHFCLYKDISDFCFMKGNDNTEHKNKQKNKTRCMWEGVRHFTELVSYIVRVHATGCHVVCNLCVLLHK